MERHQRNRVLDAAFEVFAAQGYPNTTVDDLVAAAKIGVGSFYAHFDGKEDCLLAAHDLIVEEGRAVIATAAAPAAAWTDQVCLGLRALLEWSAAEPARAKIALIEIQTGGPAALSRHEQTMAAAASFLERGRAESDAACRLPASVELTTVSGIAWLLHRRLSAGESDSLPQLSGELTEMLLEPYVGQEEARAASRSPLLPSF